MSSEVSVEAVEEFTGGVVRNFDAFPSQTWVDTATAVVRAYGNAAAAQLVPGEHVEWITPGIVHRYGKVWPNAILVVTPHRLILSANRGSLRAKHDVSSLYRGPESLLGTARRLLPGSNQELWMLELASEQGQFVFAFPDFNRAGELAELTAAFVSGRATCVHETGQILLDGAPYKPFGGFIAGVVDPFEAAPPAVAAVPEHDEPLTMAMPAALADLSGLGTATQATPLTIPEQYAPSESYDAPAALQPGWEPAPAAVSSWEPAPLVETVASEPVLTEPTPSYTVLAPADWYDDPLGQARLRYWDGTAWTHAVVG